MTEYSPLQSEIKKLIKSSGPMPVWRYMELCLTHPQYGYYVSRDPLGREGDFTTAPEVSQMFGELLGLWAASVWKAIGSPPLLRLIELGPGRGTMMADALRALRVLPPLYQSLSVHLVEINPVLREKQKATLSGVRNIAWHDSIDEVPDGPAVIFANEYFDVLPIHQVVKRETGWHERTVEIDDSGKLVFGVGREPTPRFEVLLPPLVRAAPVGAVFEWRPDAEIMKIASRVRDQDGAALIIDYGHLRSDAGDTFQAIARHSFTDPLKNPGQADVTAHVDFEALARAAEDVGARVHGPVPQGDFLKRLGIETRAVTLMAKASHEVSEDISERAEAADRRRPRRHGIDVQGAGGLRTPPRLAGGIRGRAAGRRDGTRHDARLAAALGHSRPAPRLLHPRGRRVRRHLCQPQWRPRLQRRSRQCRGKPPPDGGADRRHARKFSQRLPDPFARCRGGVTAPGPATRPRADAIVTRTEGLAIGVTAADCGPILFVDPNARVIGAAHAGWKGALTGILESTIAAMEKLGAERDGIVAAIGPLIRQHSYEVGAEFVERFIEADAENAVFFLPSTRDGHAMFDLAGFIRMRLENAGVLMIDDIGVDTYSDERFYSYRRSVHRKEPDYGRHVHAIALTRE